MSRGMPGLRRVLRVGVARRELEDELAFHFDRTVEELMSRGLTRERAEAEAERRFGDRSAYRRQIERIDRRSEAARRWRERQEVAVQSLGYGLRRIRRAPGFALAVVLTFGLGIGANATMFGVIDRLLLQPPAHLTSADQVRRLLVEAYSPQTQEREMSEALTYPDYVALAESGAFGSVAAVANRTLTVGRGSEATRLSAEATTGSYFGVLGVEPAIGRFYGPEEDQPGGAQVAVISYGLWQERYGGARDVLGRTLDFGYGPYEIIGVAPQGFTGFTLSRQDLWLPLSVAMVQMAGDAWMTSRNWYFIRVLARVRPEVSLAATEDAATAAYRGGRAEQLAAADRDPAPRVLATPVIAARGPNAGSEVQVARWLMGISVLVLLIACANVANLLLVRGLRQRREIGIRLALGSSRARVLGQVLVDSALLAALGGAAALAFTYWSAQLVRGLLLPDLAWGPTITSRVAIFVLALTAVAALVAGLIPAIQSSRPDVTETLKSSSRSTGGGRARTRNTLTALQAALTVILLVGAGLFVRSLQRVQAVDLGFEPEGILLVESVFDRDLPEQRRAAYYDAAAERLERVPGVVAASADYTIPFWSEIVTGLRIPGLEEVPQLPTGRPALHGVDPGYLDVMGLEAVRGRGLTEADDAGSTPVALVNETMARVVWPGEEALGKCLIVGATDEGEPPCATVVGVVGDTRHFGIFEGASMHYFVPRSQLSESSPPDGLLVRAAPGMEQAVIPAIRRALLGQEPGLRYAEVRPLRELVSPQYRSWELGAAMFTVFGLLALVVAGIGLYSVLAFSVAQRTFELGVRAALGATQQRIVGLVVRQALGLVGLGLAVGLGAALVLAPRAEPLLFEVSPRDPLTFLGVTLTLLAVAVLASTLPARRATRVEPTEALRAD